MNYERELGHCNVCGYEDVMVRTHDYGRFAGQSICEICEAMPRLDGNLNAALAHCTRLVIRKLGGPTDV